MKQENKNKNFIIKSTLTHGKDLFIYKNIEYVNTSTQVNLICKKHDFSFMVTPVAHFKGMGGCPLRYDVDMSNRPFVDWEAVEEALENMKLLTK